TAIVNFTFEPADDALPRYRKIVPRLAVAISRDENAVDRFVEMGLPPERAVYCPDAVFLVGSPYLPEFQFDPVPKRDAVGIIFRGGANADFGPWRTAVEAIRRGGLEVDLISSHQEIDIGPLEELMRLTGS